MALGIQVPCLCPGESAHSFHLMHKWMQRTYKHNPAALSEQEAHSPYLSPPQVPGPSPCSRFFPRNTDSQRSASAGVRSRRATREKEEMALFQDTPDRRPAPPDVRLPGTARIGCEPHTQVWAGVISTWDGRRVHHSSCPEHLALFPPHCPLSPLFLTPLPAIKIQVMAGFMTPPCLSLTTGWHWPSPTSDPNHYTLLLRPLRDPTGMGDKGNLITQPFTHFFNQIISVSVLCMWFPFIISLEFYLKYLKSLPKTHACWCPIFIYLFISVCVFFKIIYRDV